MAITGFLHILVKCFAYKIFFFFAWIMAGIIDHSSNIQVGSAICQDLST